jgi:hypothetical protein
MAERTMESGGALNMLWSTLVEYELKDAAVTATMCELSNMAACVCAGAEL